MTSMTPSQSLLTLSGITARSAPLEGTFRAFLSSVIAEPETHARFLNMLSLLEHIGSRKIMVSQMHNPQSEDLLKHMAEEARHAFFFKRQSRRFTKENMDGYEEHNTLCRTAAGMYFSRLDAELSKIVKAHCPAAHAPYLVVSLIVELRACWTYPQYHDLLEKAGIALSMKSIIAEEDAHLEEMYSEFMALEGANKLKLSDLSAVECKLFEKFLDKLTAETAAAKAA